MKKVPLDENAKSLIKKCEDNEVDTSTMGACQVLLEEMDRGNVVLKDEPGESYIQMAQNIKKEDVPQVLRIAFIVRDSGDITDTDVKNAAARLIRAIEMF
ncbi:MULTISPECIES: hypothetical protein [Methanobacterium]|uniref:Uncharacterized protein n=1 Tax=Methanobacterium bryantii TaxID=2161 RepID=A0A2A2H7C4_METBR|nr:MULTISPECIES: hypothetical protein [Methanobacterium]OEC84993.1 hypothetical protein A9507_01295 [Methanobacterium sp. A39]PAV05143.1 hypothetical protein ASJ80_12720 [Methanobacterium bryantii]